MVPVEELDDRPRRSRMRQVVAALVAILVVATLVFLGLRPTEDGRRTRGAAPEFDLPRLNGDGRLASADLEGAPYVLNFWATWCNPCRDEMPAFEKIWQRFKADGVTIIGVNLRDDPKAAKDFADELGVTYPLIVDADQELAGDLRVNALPQTFFVDERGRFFEQSTGSLGIMTEGELEDRVQAMLDARGASG
jgi:cytochrome c biogenesis protein CcmG/thiol:disulfide interchange protein DsbE